MYTQTHTTCYDPECDLSEHEGDIDGRTEGMLRLDYLADKAAEDDRRAMEAIDHGRFGTLEDEEWSAR